jgi:CubicO group peptidase (beta-lactamase class C family)
MKRIYFFFFFALVCHCLHAQPAFVKDSLDAYITKGMKDWSIPGLAIVIVKDGQIVLMKGYGVRAT